MKMYRTLGRKPWNDGEGCLASALRLGLAVASEIVEIEVTKSTRKSVWWKGENKRRPRSNRIFEHYDTEEEARDALHKYIKAHLEELEQQARNCRMALNALHLNPVVVAKD